MTPEEVRNHMNEIVCIKAPGLVKGYKEVRIIDFDPNERTIWGTGVVTTEYPFQTRSCQTRYALCQIELYTGENGDGRRRKIRRKKKDDTGRTRKVRRKTSSSTEEEEDRTKKRRRKRRRNDGRRKSKD